MGVSLSASFLWVSGRGLISSSGCTGRTYWRAVSSVNHGAMMGTPDFFFFNWLMTREVSDLVDQQTDVEGSEPLLVEGADHSAWLSSFPSAVPQV